jgi:iron complex outermembrane recepter protein
MLILQRSSLTTAALMICAAPVLAQVSNTGAPAGAEAADNGIAEIIVTAQRKEERLQDVPIAVSVIDAGMMSAKGISALTNLSSAVPNLDLNLSGPAFIPFLRGVGSTDADPNNEASIATYVDGVYQGSLQGNLSAFNNIQRIEVLKGPQGTLFGRNATGGVIQIVTRDPVDHPTLEASVGYGNYQTIENSIYASSGLAPNVAGDIAFHYSDQGKGWGRYTQIDSQAYKQRDLSVRSKILFTPTDLTKITLTSDYSQIQSSELAFQIAPPHVGLDGVSHRPSRYDVEDDFPTNTPSLTWGEALRVAQDVGFADFVSITALRINHAAYIFGVDASPIDFIHADWFSHNRQGTQEFQLISKGSSRLDWTVGAYYFNDRVTYEPIAVSGLILGGATVATYGTQRTESVSSYAQASYKLTDTTRLTAGIRDTGEEQKYNGHQFAVYSTNEQRNNRPTWRLAVDQKFTPDVLGYVSYNRGTKSGGFNLSGVTQPPTPGYKPEELDAYEIGLKSELLDHHVRFNAAGFFYDYRDLQVTAYPANQGAGANSLTLNAAKARIKGFDADLEVVPFKGLTFTAAAGYIDGYYVDFPNPSVNGPDPLIPLTLANAAGKRTVRSPKISGNLGSTYDWETSVGSFSASANVRYTGLSYFDVANLFPQTPYAVVNSSFSWWNTKGQFGVTLWGKNLTNRDYIAEADATAFGFLQAPAAPRTYGITISAKL